LGTTRDRGRSFLDSGKSNPLESPHGAAIYSAQGRKSSSFLEEVSKSERPGQSVVKTRDTSSSKETTPLSRKCLTFQDFRFDSDNGVLQRSGTELVLPPRALAVLRCLLQRPGDVISKADLVEAGWKDVAVGDQSLSEAVGILRKVLDDDPQKPTFIRTVHRRGYRFIAPVSVEAEEGGSLVPEVRRSAPRWQRWLGLASLLPFLALATAWYINSMAPTGNPVPTVKLVARGWGPYASTLSPDGRNLAFITDRGDVIVRNLQANEDRTVARTGNGFVDWPPVWSPDGRWLAYGSFEGGDDGEWQVRIVETAGGESRVVHRSSKELTIPCDWSPDGAGLLLMADPAEANLPERLLETSLADEVTKELIPLRASWPWRAAYSTDGRGIAYGAEVDEAGAIFVTDLDGDVPHRVSHDWSSDDSLVWSPDGRYILFRTRRPSSWDFWVIEMDGLQSIGGPYLVKEDVGKDSYPWSWSRDGWLLYSEPVVDTTIYTLPFESGEEMAVGGLARFSEEFRETVNHGVPSHGGDRISVAVSSENGWRFYIVSPIESHPVPVPAELAARTVIGWGPDDSWILLWGRKGGEDFLTRVFVSDNIAERVAVDPGPPLMGHFAALSPDGRWLAMEQGPYSCERELVIVNLVDGTRRVPGVGGCRLMPAWSPDGTELAVARNLEDGKQSDILIVGFDGGQRQLTQWREDIGNIGPLSWSPDGQNLAFILHRPESEKPNQLLAVPSSGGTPQLLFEPQSGKPMPNPWKPHWSADGSNIIFTGISWEIQTWMMRDFLGKY
jgi:Tol biopolymer transport system component/DNA-binding winged helix-turn-helix (wHTH) protein